LAVGELFCKLFGVSLRLQRHWPMVAGESPTPDIFAP
jgi:hypothetical protein